MAATTTLPVYATIPENRPTYRAPAPTAPVSTGLTNLLNPQDPYRQSLENALYNRQADVINTQSDLAQTQGRENAFGRGVGFSSILPDYSTAPIERERLRALNAAQQNAFLGAGQEARANLAASNQPLQFRQSQAQQAAQFEQQRQLQQRALSQQANQNLMAGLLGGGAGLATLLLRPQPSGSSTLGGNLWDWLGTRGGQGMDKLASLWGGSEPAADLGSNLINADIFGNVAGSELGGTLADSASNASSSLADLLPLLTGGWF